MKIKRATVANNSSSKLRAWADFAIACRAFSSFLCQVKRTPVSIVMLVITLSSAFSAIEYDNFGPGNTYAPALGYFVSSQYSDANSFSASLSGMLTSIDFGATTQTPNDHTFNVSIALDTNGHPDGIGTFLGTISPTTSAGGPNSGSTIVSLAGLAYPLISGTPYWIELAVAGPNDVGVWNASTTATSPNMQQSADGGATWAALSEAPPMIGAFRVNATPVPEPSTLVASVVLSCFLAIGIAQRRRQKAGFQTDGVV